MGICVGVEILMEGIPRSRMKSVMLCVQETRHRNAADFGEAPFLPLVSYTIFPKIRCNNKAMLHLYSRLAKRA